MLLVAIGNAALLKASADSTIVCNGAESQRLQAGVAKQAKDGARRGAHLRAGAVRRAPGPLAPRSTLAAQLLSAMLSHSLQQQVVDGGEVIVAAALQRLMRTEQSHDFAFFTVPSLLHSVPNQWFSLPPAEYGSVQVKI